MEEKTCSQNPQVQFRNSVDSRHLITNGQDLQLQIDALLKAGVLKKLIFVDKISGSKAARPGLDEGLGQLRDGDTLKAWRLDRLGWTVRRLIELVEQLHPRYRPSCKIHPGGRSHFFQPRF